MKYLFFDLECANCFGGTGKICSFGYLAADGALAVCDRGEDILIDPCVTQWDWYVVKKILNCNISAFKGKPRFPDVYERLRGLLEAPDTVAVGFDLANDVTHLMDECRRYKLPLFSYPYIDVKLLAELLETYEHRSLDGLYREVCGKEPEAMHHSDYDAKMTYEIFAGICRDHAIDPAALLKEKSPVCGRAKGFSYGFNGKPMLDRQQYYKKKAEEEKRKRRLAAKKAAAESAAQPDAAKNADTSKPADGKNRSIGQ